MHVSYNDHCIQEQSLWYQENHMGSEINELLRQYGYFILSSLVQGENQVLLRL